MKSRQSLATEFKRIELYIDGMEKALEKFKVRRNAILDIFTAPLIARMESYLASILVCLKKHDNAATLPLVFDRHEDDAFVVSHVEKGNADSRTGDREIKETADLLYLSEPARRVMVCFNSSLVGRKKHVPFSECAAWLCGTHGSPEDKEMLMVRILNLIDKIKDNPEEYSNHRIWLAVNMAGLREFSIGALDLDDRRYDKFGNLAFGKGTVRIKAGQYAGCDKVEVVRIPEGITEIEDGAFRGCSRLQRVDLPKSLVKIGNGAFKDCERIQRVFFPEGLLSIGAEAFYGCSCLQRVDLPKSLVKIGDSAFKDCEKLQRIDFPMGLLSIGAEAFYGCSFKCINLPDSLETLGDKAFRGVRPLYVSHGPIRIVPARIGIGKGTVMIDRTKKDLEELASLVNHAYQEKGYRGYYAIPEGLTEIGDGAFSRCFGLTEVHIPDSVTEIGKEAFQGCFGLAEIIIPDKVMEIGNEAFTFTPGLTRIKVSLYNGTFDSRNDCNAIIETASNTLVAGCRNTIIPNSVTRIGDFAFSGCSGLTGIHLPDSVSKIGDGAFSGCSGLTEIYIPDSVTKIGSGAFDRCPKLSRIEVSHGNGTFDSRNDCNAIIETASNTLVAGCSNTIIPDSVTRIEGWAFYGCSGLTEIHIPDSVTRIGLSALEDCSGLIEIHIPDSVTMIGDRAFARCSSLTTISVPKGLDVSKAALPDGVEIIER